TPPKRERKFRWSGDESRSEQFASNGFSLIDEFATFAIVSSADGLTQQCAACAGWNGRKSAFLLTTRWQSKLLAAFTTAKLAFPSFERTKWASGRGERTTAIRCGGVARILLCSGSRKLFEPTPVAFIPGKQPAQLRRWIFQRTFSQLRWWIVWPSRSVLRRRLIWPPGALIRS